MNTKKIVSGLFACAMIAAVPTAVVAGAAELPPVVYDIAEDFIVTGGSYQLYPGTQAEIEFSVSSGGHRIILAQCELDFPSELRTEIRDRYAYCAQYDTMYSYLNNNTITATFKDPKTSDATLLNDEEPILVVEVTVPADAPIGSTYKLGFKSYHVVEDAFKPVEFDATVEYATITVIADPSKEPPCTVPLTTSTTTTETSTTTTTTTETVPATTLSSSSEEEITTTVTEPEITTSTAPAESTDGSETTTAPEGELPETGYSKWYNAAALAAAAMTVTGAAITVAFKKKED